ncbi:MAG: hypothetical protein AAFN65_07990 [Bacteroidota bacterium]
MGIWNWFSHNFSTNSQKYQSVQIPDYRVDIPYDSEPIHAGQAYCRLVLVEMCLGKKIDWFKKKYPIVHSAVRFNYGSDVVTIPYLAGPEFFRKFGDANLDRVIPCNHYMTPLFPYNRGLFEVQAGLFSMVASRPLAKFSTAVARFAQLLPVPELSTVLNLVDPIYKGIEDLVATGDGALELGYQQTFTESGGGGSNELRAGYFAVILSDENEVITDKLCVVDDSLRLGFTGKSKIFIRDEKPLKGHSYMLFRLEKRAEQDWESLSLIKDLVYKAQDLVLDGQYEVVRKNLIPAIRVAIFRSPDIARCDRKPMILKIEETLEEYGLQASTSVRMSLYSIMQRELSKEYNLKEKELDQLSSLYSNGVN